MILVHDLNPRLLRQATCQLGNNDLACELVGLGSGSVIVDEVATN